MADGRGKNVASLRNLPQFKGMSDSEILAATTRRDVRSKVEERIDKLGEEFDLSDMQYHDLLLLERFFTALIRLEEAEADLEDRYEDLGANEKAREEAALSTLRNDILKMQNELGISKLRRAEQLEDNPVLLFDDIRSRAKKFLEERLCWVNCPVCGMQLTKVHFTYPKVSNTLTLICGRCEHEFKITSEEILEAESKNPYR
jgi:hypothetical protein